jgi:hypothetical protein
MKHLFAGLLFLILSISAKAQVDYSAYTEVNLSIILSEIEKQHKVVFSFDADLVGSKFISLQKGSYTLSEILERLEDQANLSFDFIDGQNILIYRPEPKQYALCGYLKDEQTLDPIAFANIYTPDGRAGTSSNEAGYFEIQIEGDPRLLASYLGYQKLELIAQSLADSTCLDFLMKLGGISFKPVLLKEYLTDGISQSNLGNTVIIDPGEMSMLPGAVDNDVLASIQFLPGISSPSESLSNIHIRGGTPDQNLILWDDIPLFHTSHLFGTISALNPFVIDKVNVYRSGVNSEFGGRVSGVIDIETKNEIISKFKGSAGINFTHTYLNLNIPLWKNSSLQFSSRRSITDGWSSPTFISYAEKVFQGTKIEENDFNQNQPFSDEFKFNDGHLKWMWKTGSNLFTISSIGALNSLNYTNEIPAFDAFSTDQLNLENAGFKMGWERKWSEKLNSNLHISNSVYSYDYTLFYQLVDSMGDPPILFNTSNRIEDISSKFQLDYTLSETQKISTGVEFQENTINLDLVTRNQMDTTSEAQVFDNRLGTLFGTYILTLPGILRMDIGLRYQNHALIKKNYFEPRIAFLTDVNENVKLKISTGKHFQFISQLAALDINDLGLGNQIWVAANDSSIPVIESNQWMAGFSYQKDQWTIDIEGYVKEIAGITSLTSGFEELERQPFSIGDSRIRGIDVLVKRRVGAYRSWLSYTLSDVRYEFQNISQEAFPASHDRTHLIQWVNLYKRSNWEFSLGWTLGSPLPYTPNEGLDTRINPQGNLQYRIDYAPINSARLNPYSRIDASMVYKYTLNDTFSGFISFSIQNLGDRQNLLGRQFLLSQSRPGQKPDILNNDELGLGFTPNIALHLAW